MGLFGKSKKEREKEYMNRLDVPLLSSKLNTASSVTLKQVFYSA